MNVKGSMNIVLLLLLLEAVVIGRRCISGAARSVTPTSIIIVVMRGLATKVVVGMIDAHAMGGIDCVGCGSKVALGACGLMPSTTATIRGRHTSANMGGWGHHLVGVVVVLLCGGAFIGVSSDICSNITAIACGSWGSRGRNSSCVGVVVVNIGVPVNTTTFRGGDAC